MSSAPVRHRDASSGLARLVRRLRAARRRNRWVRWLQIATLPLLLIALLVVAWPFAHAHLQSIAVLELVSNQPVPPLLRRFVSEPIQVRDLQLALPGGAVRGRMYTPARHQDAPALVVLHGVHHLGMNEPRLVTFASAMAACGVRVLTPELPDIKDYHVGANSIATIGESAEWMAQRNGGRSVGVMGLSFSGGLALLAAADPQFRPSIRFVLAVGAQDEMARVSEYYRTGEDERPSGAEQMLKPHEYGALVLEYEHLDEFVPTQDLAPLRAVLRAHLYEDAEGEKAARERLTPEQEERAKALLNPALPATRDALARAEAKHIEEMAGVSPHGHLAQMTTPVYLLHGEGDNIIPSAETEWMEAELPSETLKAALISPVLSHLDLDGAGPTALDHVRLVHFFALVLHAAQER